MKNFHCLYCHASLGHTDGSKLQIANCIFYQPVTMECFLCGTVRKWRPVLDTTPANFTPLPERLEKSYVSVDIEAT